MNTFKLIAIFLINQAGLAQADVVTFSNDQGRLSGTLMAIGENGIIEWQSAYSNENLKLLTEKLDKVELSTTTELKQPAPIQLTLRNGDILPIKRLVGMNDDGLIAETSVIGTRTIPTSALASAQFGMTPPNLIYSGFKSIREWVSDDNYDNWEFDNQSLVSSGESSTARDFQLPENFILSFSLSWDTDLPSYSIDFADPMAEDTNKQDHYSFKFDSAGIRITRFAPGDSRDTILARWTRRPSQFEDSTMDVKLRVNRSKRWMELIINGESEGLVVDTLDELAVPAGSGISIKCHPKSGTQSIERLRIWELDDSRSRHLAEERGDSSLDCLITTSEDRWSGQLLSLEGDPENRVIVFKPNFAAEAWSIPESEISTLFFADTPPADPSADNSPSEDEADGHSGFIIEFHQEGTLSTSSCTIYGDETKVLHPLLGSLELQRQAIKLIRRTDRQESSKDFDTD